MKYINLIIVALFLNIASNAQTGKVSSKTGIRKGVLKNGLTYYVYNNPVSRGKVNFYLVQDVGAILEEDSQNGLAHFLEHMCFNGTKNFPGNTIMEKFRAKSLPYSINAYTGIDQTVYHLTGIPISDGALCDESLLILYDWCNNVTLESEKIEAERPVILEEMRTRNNLGFRISEQTSAAIFNNSKYSKRNIIGPPEIIKNFKEQELIDFYNTWYHTGLQAVVVIGDVDPIETEAKIKRLFSTLPKLENPKERYHIEIPDNEETHYVEVRDKELKEPSVRILFRHDFDKNNLEEQNKTLILNALLGARVKKLLKDDQDKDKNEEPSFSSLSMMLTPIAYGYAAYSINLQYKDGKAEQAMNRALGMHKDLIENGFTEEEFNRTTERMLKAFKLMKKLNGMLPNKQIFEEIKANFIEKTDILDGGAKLKSFEKLIKNLSLNDLQEKLKEWYSGPNKSIIVLGGEDDKLLSHEEVLAYERDCEIYKVIPDEEDEEDEDANKDLLKSESLKEGEIVKTERISEIGAERWTLANGAKVIYKECNANPELISIFASSPGGLSVLEDKELINGVIFSGFLSSFGIDGYTKDEFENLLKNNQISCVPVLAQHNEELYLQCKYANVETAFQIMNQRFRNPAFYAESFDETYEKIGKTIKNKPITHQMQISDSIALMRFGSKKFHPVNDEWYESISIEKLEEVYRDRFSDAGNFTFYIIGGIGKSRAKKMAQKYIGSIESTGRNEVHHVLENHLTQGRTKRTYRFDIPGGQAGVIYNMDFKAEYSFKNNLCMSIMQSFMQEKLHGNIREKERGTYGVHAKKRLEQHNERNACFEIRFECDPERAEELDDILHQAVVELCTKGMSKSEFDIAKKKFDKPQVPPRRDNNYYLGILKEYETLGTNNSEEDFYKKQLDSIDLEYINGMFKNLIENAAILDVVYLPK